MAVKTGNRPMSKSQISSHLAERFGFSRKTGAELLEEIATLAVKESKRGFTLPGLGKLVVVKRKERMGRNPQTGEAIRIPAKTVIKFRIAKAAKDAALKK